MTKSKETQVKEQLNIRLVLDRSGSMSSCRVETVESINEYINEIQKEAVEGVFTLSTFDNKSIDIPISRIPVRELTILGQDILIPRGGTPLYDAIGTAVHDLSTFTYKEDEKKVLVIVTDGYENASREYTSDAIKQLIEEKTKEGWLILYLGADHDAFTQSRHMGFETAKTLQYAKRDSKDAFKAVATRTSTYYKGSRFDKNEFLAEERTKANKEWYNYEEE
jgi:uncharacterized protein YegL